MSAHQSSGLQIEVVPGIPSHGVITMSRGVGFREPMPADSTEPETSIMKIHDSVPDLVIDNRPLSYVENEYHHTIEIPRRLFMATAAWW